MAAVASSKNDGIRSYYLAKNGQAEVAVEAKERNLARLQAQRNELNTRVRSLREEVSKLHEAGAYIGEVVKVMGKKKVLVKMGNDGKYVVNIDKDIDIAFRQVYAKYPRCLEERQLQFVQNFTNQSGPARVFDEGRSSARLNI